MVMQREYTGVYPGSAKEGPTSSGGRVLYFLAPKCLRRGYKLFERESIPSLKKREKNRVLLEMLISKVEEVAVFVVPPPPWRVHCLPFYRVK
jgi:hypothetical protein